MIDNFKSWISLSMTKFFFLTSQILKDPKLPLTYIEHSLEQVCYIFSLHIIRIYKHSLNWHFFNLYFPSFIWIIKIIFKVFCTFQYQVLFPSLWSVIEQIQASKVHKINDGNVTFLLTFIYRTHVYPQ